MTRVATRLGEVEGVDSGASQTFFGLPFAAPPVGALRWRPPAPAARWQGTWQATRPPNRNYQLTYPNTVLPEDLAGAMSEDMLYLNVYTPAADAKRRPVFIYIHGGGYSAGSANDFDPSPFAIRHDMVVVAMNYRLSMFGFLDLEQFGDAFAGSASIGFQDQIAALRWVKDNIADYGGDPDNVTLTGVSAGAGSVLALMGAPSAVGLFHRAIAFSPAEISRTRIDTIGSLAKTRDLSADAFFAHLQSLNGAELFKLQSESKLGGLACVDGKIIVAPIEAAIEARINPVPLIVGNCIAEGAMLTPALETYPGYEFGQIIADHSVMAGGGDAARYTALLDAKTNGGSLRERLTHMWYDYFRSPTLRAALASERAGQKAWVYSFEAPTDHPFGPTHSSDMVFSYNLFDACPVGEGEMFAFHRNTEGNRRLAHQWSDAVARFARGGDPNGPGFPAWECYTAARRESLALREAPVIVRAMDSEEAHRAYGAIGA